MCDYTQHVYYIEYSVSITVIGNCLYRLLQINFLFLTHHPNAFSGNGEHRQCGGLLVHSQLHLYNKAQSYILLALRTWAPLSTSHLTKISVDTWRGIAMSVLLVSNINWICTIASWQW